MTSKKLGTGFVVLLVALVVGSYLPQVQGEDDDGAIAKPMKISGGGEAAYFPLPGLPPTTYYADGTATHLGNYHAEGKFQFDTLDPSTLSGEFSSGDTPTVFTAADGDELHCDFAGTYAVTPQADGTLVGVFIATFAPVEGASTGRFTNIGGSFVMTATTAPFASVFDTNIPYTWVADGSLDWEEDE